VEHATWPAIQLARGFRLLSALRGGWALHPKGVAFRVEVEIRSGAAARLPGTRLFATARSYEGIVRLSRAVGLPETMPDIYGAALRVLDAYGEGRDQDLLFATGALPGPLRHLLLPARTFADRVMSTLLPYALPESRAMMLLRVEDRGAPLRTRADLREAAEHGRLAMTLLAAPVVRGRPHAVATVRVGEPLAPEHEGQLRFNPAKTGGGLELSTALNRWRPPSYRASQRERPRR
jgi:hypothetical protein